MTPATAEELVREVVAACTGLAGSELAGDAGLRAGTWTSLQHLTVLLAVAKRARFILDARLVRDLNTIEDMVRHVCRPTAEVEMTDVVVQLRDLLAGPNVAVLASVRPDGRPQQFVVWAEMEGDDVLLSTTDDRPKYRNLAQDPHASLLVYPVDDQYSSVHVQGVADFTTDGAADLIDRLSQRYKGKPWVEPPNLGKRVTVRLRALEPGKD